MIDRSASLRVLGRASSRVAAAISLLAGLACLGGCSGIGDSFASAAFVDPSRYDQYDCKQLEAERKALAARTIVLQDLIDKAETGTGGVVVGELVYRNDFISIRASAKLAEENWQRYKCVETIVPAAAVPPAPVAAPAVAARKRS